MKKQSMKSISFFLVLVLAVSLLVPTSNVFADSATDIKVYYKLNSAGEDINYSFYVENKGSTTIDLSEVKVRYWYTRGQPKKEQFGLYGTNGEYNHLVPMFITVPGYENADTIFELSFENYNGYTLDPGEKSFIVDVKIWEQDGYQNQNNDYSIITNNNSTTKFIYNSKISTYINNVYISGDEPGFASGDDVSTMIFTEENFDGDSINLPVGLYTTEQLIALGLDDNSASSILVKSGYRVTLYEYNNFNYNHPSGKVLIRTKNDPSFVNNNFHNITSSIIVEKITDPIDNPNPPTITDDEDDDEIPAGVVVDLAVNVTSDKMKYANGQIITYTIEYKNNYNVETGPISITAQIPEYTSILSNAGGTVEEDTITWDFTSLEPNEEGRIIYKVTVDDLDIPEVYVTNTVEMNALEDIVENEENTQSIIKVLLFSNQANEGQHTQYIVGYPDGEFKPSNNITRAEIATILARISGITDPDKVDNIFPDVSADHWASGFIAAATQELGLFSGYTDGTFKPDAPITRAELATLTSKFLEMEMRDPYNNPFTDSTTHWANKYIAEAYRYQLISGYPDGTFRPNNYLSRAECVTMINKMTYRGPLAVDNGSFPDVLSTHWAFKQVESAARTYEFVRTANGEEVLKSATSIYTLEPDGFAVLR